MKYPKMYYTSDNISSENKFTQKYFGRTVFYPKIHDCDKTMSELLNII